MCSSSRARSSIPTTTSSRAKEVGEHTYFMCFVKDAGCISHVPHFMTLLNASFFVLALSLPFGFALDSWRWLRGEIGVLDLLGPHYGLLLAGVPHVLHLGGDTLLVDDVVLPLGSFDVRKRHVALELHVVVVHAQGCDLAIHCLEENLEQDRLLVLHDDGLMVTSRPVCTCAGW